MSKKTTRALIYILSILLVTLVLIVSTIFRQTAKPDDTPVTEINVETPQPTPEKIEVVSISIRLESTEVAKGSRFIPEIIIQPSDATDKTYELYSSNEEVLYPIGQYWIAADVGTVDLVVTASNGITGYATVTVISTIDSIEFLEDEITLHVGDTLVLTPITDPIEALENFNVTFTSDNENVAIASPDGTILAVGVGTATIECTIGQTSATIKLTVVNPVRQVIINLNRRVFSLGEKVEFSVRIHPEDAIDSTYTVSYSGAAVSAAGDNSFVCAAAGDVTITAKTVNGVTGNFVITVHDLAALADEVLRLTNIERAHAGVGALEKMQVLAQAADVRANEIIVSFDHTRPDGRECATVLKELNVPYTTAGENLAKGYSTPEIAVKAWMNSKTGHREALLDSDYKHIGVGVAMDGYGGLYWTQLFTD